MKVNPRELKDKRTLLLVPLVVVASTVGVQAFDGNSFNDEVSPPEPISAPAEEASVNGDSKAEPTVSIDTTTTSPVVRQQAVAPATAQAAGDPETPPVEGEETPPPEPPAPYIVGHVKRLVEIPSGPSGENRQFKQFCDYTYSDGSVQTVLKAIISPNVTIDC